MANFIKVFNATTVHDITKRRILSIIRKIIFATRNQFINKQYLPNISRPTIFKKCNVQESSLNYTCEAFSSLGFHAFRQVSSDIHGRTASRQCLPGKNYLLTKI